MKEAKKEQEANCRPTMDDDVHYSEYHKAVCKTDVVASGSDNSITHRVAYKVELICCIAVRVGYVKTNQGCVW